MKWSIFRDHDVIVPFCADCNEAIPVPPRIPQSEIDRHRGRSVQCTKGDTHHAEFVKGSVGQKWLRFAYILGKIQDKYSLSGYLKSRGLKVGVILLFRFLILLLLTPLALMDQWFTRISVGVVTIYFMLEILAVSTSVAFVRRGPILALRTVIMSFFAFVQLAICFSVFYAMLWSEFEPKLDFVGTLYFSFVTITTLGYGDIHPCKGAWLAQLLVVLEVASGIFFLAVIVSIITGWANNVPVNAEKVDLSKI